MDPRSRRPYLRILSVAVVLLLIGLLESSPTAATYAGRAVAAFVNAPSLGASSIYLADSGQLSPSGGWEAADLLGATVPAVLSAEVLRSATVGKTESAASSTSLANITVLPGHAAELAASFVSAETWAAKSGTTGATQIEDLTFGGVPVTVTGLANQRVDIPGVATLIINEQSASGSGGTKQIAVNALHLTLATGEEIIVGSAQSAVSPHNDIILADNSMDSAFPARAIAARSTATSPVPSDIRSARVADLGRKCASVLAKPLDLLTAFGLRPAVLMAQKKPPEEEEQCFDFVTYGGYFFGSTDGPGRVNFGGNAGYKNGPPPPPLMVHVNVVDHNSGRHIKLHTALSYGPGDRDPCHCREFSGAGTQTLNNITTDITGTVEVCDFGEPGNHPKGTDVFEIAVPGYSATGSPIIGGNVQLHKQCKTC